MDETIKFSIWVDVDFTKSKKEMIAAGKYVSVDSRLLFGEFPVKGSGAGRVNILLLNFGRQMTSAEVISALEELKLRPMNFRELLALGNQYPKLQLNFPILAFGSTVWKDPEGLEYCGALAESKGQRMLGMIAANDDRFIWKVECCFGGVALAP